MKRAFLLLVCSLLPLGGVVADPLPPAPPQNLRLVADNGNRAPLATDDEYSVVQGQELVVPAPGVLANDSDPDGDELEVELVSGTTSGTINLNSDGSFNYISNADFSGRDSFTYRVSDGQIFSNHATVWILVRRTGTAPWFEDSFEGTPPTGWNSKWIGNTWSKFATFDTTKEGGTPHGGGQYSYRQRFMAPDDMQLVTPDNTTNTFTAADHGYEDGNLIRFWHLHQGGTLPTGIEHSTDLGASFSVFYRVMNTTQNTFQVRPNLEETGPTNITNNGVPPLYTTLARQVTADHATNTFTAADHGLEDDAPITLHLLGQGGTLPTGIEMHTESYSYQYHVMNATQDTFQVRRYLTSSNPTSIIDNGVNPFYVSLQRLTGRLAMYFGGSSPVPHTIGDRDDISISYWIKYHPDFNWGTEITGNKQWMLDAGFTGSGTGRIYQITAWGSEQTISPSGTGGMWSLSANVGGPFYMPTGEWVKFDWYIKVSPESGDGGMDGEGIIMGWVNNALRYDYSNIPTIKSGAFSSFHYWNQHSNNVPRGENQERYLDLFRIGPGAMVLSEQGLLP